MDLMLDLQSEFNTSFVFVSHDLSNARYFAEHGDGRVGVMYLGNLVEVGPPDRLIEDPQHPLHGGVTLGDAEPLVGRDGSQRPADAQNRHSRSGQPAERLPVSHSVSGSERRVHGCSRSWRSSAIWKRPAIERTPAALTGSRVSDRNRTTSTGRATRSRTEASRLQLARSGRNARSNDQDRTLEATIRTSLPTDSHNDP